MKLPWILTLALLGSAAEASLQKLCVPAEMTSGPAFFLSVNSDSQKAAEAMNASLSRGQIKVEPENSGPRTQFVQKQTEPGDCLLFNDSETTQLAVEPLGNVSVQPAILFRAADGAKLFGLIETKSLPGLKPSAHAETPEKALMAHLLRQRDLSFLYVLCPKRRDGACRLTIRHKGKWISEKGKKLEYRVLAKATQSRGRVLPGGDTPQGIYYLWATMFTEEPAFGSAPRVDLDANFPPLNAHPYEIHSYLLSRLIPDEARNDYWVNEWPLAYRLGRIHLRIHGNASGTREEFKTTAGCLNAGERTQELLSKLEGLGLLATASSRTRNQSDPSSLGWRVSPALGRAFLIVRDGP